MLKGKKIIVGVTASIAAYKAAFLIRLLVKEGAQVKVVMTQLAKEFITPLTLATLSKNPVLIDLFNPENGEWNNHVDLGLWADALVVSPATANTIGKMAHGIADNLLLTTYLSARCPVFVAPAMDLDMLNHPATQNNIVQLRDFGNIIIEPDSGELASGLEGKGRMQEPGKIVKTLAEFFQEGDEKKKSGTEIAGKKILITAGPTYEPIDPVRFIGNYSSGKMGYALAGAFTEAGASVTLISGPVSLPKPEKITEFIQVQTAEEMFLSCNTLFPDMDIAVMAAAVADYRPESPEKNKIKSTRKELSIHLMKNKDIAAELGKIKRKDQYLVGFALETSDEEQNARTKMTSKNLDMIVLNSMREVGAGFGFETNKISIFTKDNKVYNFGLKNKSEVAEDIITVICENI